MDQKLIRSLRGAGKLVETVGFADGSQVLLLPYGGRILGLFAGGDPRNFYWVNPAPAIGGVSGLRRTEDVAQVWAYRGPPAQIALIAKRLLGASPGTLPRG